MKRFNNGGHGEIGIDGKRTNMRWIVCVVSPGRASLNERCSVKASDNEHNMLTCRCAAGCDWSH